MFYTKNTIENTKNTTPSTGLWDTKAYSRV